jgi:hypothetical protein
MRNKTANAFISLADWNDVVNDTLLPQYGYQWRSSFTSGGVLDAYRIAGNSFILGSIDDNITLYNDYRDTRSNYMFYSSTGHDSNWRVATNFTNSYSTFSATGVNRDARLVMSLATGTITTLSSSIYLIYAEMTIPSVTSQVKGYMQIRRNGVNVADISNSGVNISAQSVSLQGHYLSIYSGANYTLRWRTEGSAPHGNVQIRFGYSEFIGNKNKCGATS